MKKYIIQLLMAAVLAIILFSCSGELVMSGRYVVTDVRNKTVNFKKINGKPINGDYHFPDPVKVGDTVYLQRTKDISKANIW